MISMSLALICLHALCDPATPPTHVRESRRRIPVAYEVDVAVIGGSTGAVAAAIAAAQEGAKVFLAAPRTYLGEDMAGTLQLWLNDNEVPSTELAKRMFSPVRPRQDLPSDADLLKFTYRSSLPSSGRHQDTDPPSLLCDGRWSSATSQSVQYDGDVQISLDLETEKEVGEVLLMAYHSNDFQVGDLVLQSSLDGQSWQETTRIRNTEAPQGSVTEEALSWSLSASVRSRYLRISVTRSTGAARLLLGEIAVVRAGAIVPEKTTTDSARITTPFQVKRSLDEALLEAGVRYLYACYATEVLRDETGALAGIVMANRAGRQAVLAKILIDATDQAWVARMADARMEGRPAGPQPLTREVIGGMAQTGEGVTSRPIKPAFRQGTKSFDVFEYTLMIPMEDGSYASWAKAEQVARNRTYHADQVQASDKLWGVPVESILGEGSGDLKPFRPSGIPRLFVLSGCADLSREDAEKLLSPLRVMEVGEQIGKRAAQEAQAISPLSGVHLPGDKTCDAVRGEVKECLSGVRDGESMSSIPEDKRSLPILGSYDVVVIGGGTSGAPAGIAAARQGARVLVVEYQYGLGGVGTLGLITKYYWGNRVGFTKELPEQEGWEPEQRMEWWRTELLKAGADIWFGAMGCGAFVQGKKVAGAVVATPQGRGVVLAQVVIDSTGNADIAAAAGAECLTTDATDFAVQGTGLPGRNLGASYINTDFTIVDETDMLDVWQVFVCAKLKDEKLFDLGQLVDTRERRRIKGDFTISVLDQMNGRTYPDSVVEAYSNFDSHGYTVDPSFILKSPDHAGWRTYIPYRALLPKKLDGLLVTGLGVSAHRDAIPVIRMEPDIQNQGYAAGVAAAMAARDNHPLRDIDVKLLQKHLVDVGNLPEHVLTDQDSYPLPQSRIAQAVEHAKEGYKDVSVLLAFPRQAKPLLRKAYAAATTPEHRLVYAHILACMGDATGVEDLISAVEASSGWDEGWNYRSAGQFGFNMSRLDSLITALGWTRDARALPVLLSKLKLLTPDLAFSHHRAMALALEAIGDPRAAAPLAELLQVPGYRGRAIQDIHQAMALEKQYPAWATTEPRALAIRELILGRALYRCGDHEGLGREILEEYAQDLRGHWARHARAVLGED